MTENELFNIIDEGIDIFKRNEGYQKGIKVYKNPHSDWLIFNWRQLTWKENELNYIMEVYPNFDQSEIISSWTFYSAVYYDSQGKRYYLKNNSAAEQSLEFIAHNILNLFISGYNYITSVPRKEIPFAVDLKPIK